MCVGFRFEMRVCSSVNLSVLIEMSPFNVTHSRSKIEWSSLLMCLAIGSPLLLSWMLFCDCSCVVKRWLMFHLCSCLSHIFCI